MSYKTASKTNSKASHSEVAKFGIMSGELKTFPFGKSGKGLGHNLKHAALAEKMKTAYVSQMHTAVPGVEFAVIAPAARKSSQQKSESELAEKLVTAVAEQSADVSALCETYQLKREELGRLTGFSLRALAEWAAGKLPSQPARRRLQEVRRLLDALAQIVKPEGIPKWLHRRNAAFDHLTPLQVIELGEIDRLWAMVHDMGSGQPG
jgi:DNA-binding transcriptional regulator YiaG